MKPAQHGTSAPHGISAMPAAAAVNAMPETAFIPPNAMPIGHMMGQQPFQGPASMAGMMPGIYTCYSIAGMLPL